MSLVNNHFIETALIKRGETAVLCSCLCMNCHVAAKLVHQNEYLKKKSWSICRICKTAVFATVAMQLSGTFNSCVENAKLSIKPGFVFHRSGSEGNAFIYDNAKQKSAIDSSNNLKAFFISF